MMINFQDITFPGSVPNTMDSPWYQFHSFYFQSKSQTFLLSLAIQYKASTILPGQQIASKKKTF